jgi:hypothetical protein
VRNDLHPVQRRQKLSVCGRNASSHKREVGSRERLEAAALRALITGACRYRSVESMLKNSLDRQPLEAAPDLGPPPRHDNIRGAEYFDRGEPAC